MIDALPLAQTPPPAITVDCAEAIIADTFERLGESGGARLMVVQPDHWALRKPAKGRRYAAAMRTRDGGEWIAVDATATAEELKAVIQHEVAHIIAWRRHGIRIKEHGAQFLKICRAAVTERPNEFCRRD